MIKKIAWDAFKNTGEIQNIQKITNMNVENIDKEK